ncbi:MAG: porin family protein [Bacteroidales bacterium]
MKRFYLVAFLAIISMTLNAQIHFGPKIGYSASKLSIDQSAISTELKSSFTFGAFVRVGGKFYVQPEVNWQTVGGLYKSPSLQNLVPLKSEVNLKSIEIPVLFGWRLVNLGIGNIRLMAGPSATIVTDKKIDNKFSNYTTPIKDSNINDVLWGAQVGVGVDVLMFTLDVRYSIGLSNVIKDIKVGSTPITFDSKANVFTVGLGWKIL